MALNPNEKFTTTTGVGSGKRIFPTSAQAMVFAAGTGTLAEGTPVAFDTSVGFWKLFQDAGINGIGVIKGFLTKPVTLDSDEEVMGVVMLNGRIHIDDIPIVTGYTLAQLKAKIKAGVRDLGIIVEGMAGDFN